MGDVGDYWKENREHLRKKKAVQRGNQRSKIPSILANMDAYGIIYRQLDAYGEHYRIAEEYDWWPSTGRWRKMRGGETGFDVSKVISKIGKRPY